MAKRRRIPLTQINGVAAGQTATISLDTNLRYHSIHIEYGTATAGGAIEANMIAELTDTSLKIDGVEQRGFSAEQLFGVNRRKGIEPDVSAAQGFLDIFFSEPQRETRVEQEATAWGMEGVGSFQIKIKIDAGAANPTLTGYVEVDDVAEVPVGIVKWQRETIQVAGTGSVPYKLNTLAGDSYQGLFFFENAANDIAELLVKWDGVELENMSRAQISNFTKRSEFAEVAKLVHIPLDDNFPANGVPSVKVNSKGQRVNVHSFIAKLEMAVASNVDLIAEAVGTFD